MDTSLLTTNLAIAVNTLLALIVLAFTVEAITENIKWVYEKGFSNPDRITALIVAAVVAVFTGVNVYNIIGIPMAVPLIDEKLGMIIGDIVGRVLTALIILRGGTWVHDWIKKTFTHDNIPTEVAEENRKLKAENKELYAQRTQLTKQLDKLSNPK